jgi:hypothetical protein
MQLLESFYCFNNNNNNNNKILLYFKAREFIEIDSDLSTFNNPLLQLKMQKPDRLRDAKLMNNLLNCFRHRRNLLRKNSNSNLVSIFCINNYLILNINL